MPQASESAGLPFLVQPGAVVNIGNILEEVVMKALTMKSSDIHFEPRDEDLVIRFRIDGILRDIALVDKETAGALIFKIKVSAKLQTDEHFIPQDGRMQFKLQDGKELNVRVSMLPISRGEKVVFRLLTELGRDFALSDLGIEQKELVKIERNFRKPYGMIVVTGPTGSGKTTTLYTIMKQINSRDINIVTIEDPVEYDIDGINHVQIHTKANLTFAIGLRAILRQDPDVVMIGEIRDGETARIAINAAMTGHLVFSTLHTNDAVTAVPRFVDMGIEPYLLASTLSIVVGQRLGRKLCPECKEQHVITEEELKELAIFRPDLASVLQAGEKIFRKGKGCKKCGNVGYKGRIGFYEVLEVTKAIRQMIISNPSSDNLFDLARKEGFTIIVEDGIKKVRDGTVDLEELVRVTAVKE